MSKSNIQQLDHIDKSKISHVIKHLNNEIKFGQEVNLQSYNQTINNTLKYCKNGLTSQIYSFTKGSTKERELFRVMPIDGTEKLYFDSEDEYNTWIRKNRKSRTLCNSQYIN